MPAEVFRGGWAGVLFPGKNSIIRKEVLSSSGIDFSKALC